MNRKVTLLGLPFDGNSSYLRGTSLAPPLIRAALRSDSSNMWTENGIDLGSSSVLHDAGDLEEPVYENTPQAVSKLLDSGFCPILLGGDHSLSFPIVKAIHQKYPQLTILHFDAHPDLYHNFEGNPRSHASPFARIMEEKLAQRLVQIGIRTANQHQREQARKFGVEMMEMKNERVIPKFDSPVYISFDIDALDPAFAPGIAHPEPGGLSTREAVDLIQAIDAEVVGADIVEYNPNRDLNGITAMVAAKLLKEIAAKMIG